MVYPRGCVLNVSLPSRRLTRRVGQLESQLCQATAHFEKLRLALGQDAHDGFAALAQRALGAFSVIYSERGMHNEPRFSALQDVLVSLSLAASRLTYASAATRSRAAFAQPLPTIDPGPPKRLQGMATMVCADERLSG